MCMCACGAVRTGPPISCEYAASFYPIQNTTVQTNAPFRQREIEKVPKELPVLVLGNFRDKGEHRAVESMSVC